MNLPVVRTGLPEAAKPTTELVIAGGAPGLAPGHDAQPSSAATDAKPPANEASASAPVIKPAYPPPAATMTQEGARGLRFDFNDGCRATFPESEHAWQVCMRDLDTGNVLFQTEFKGGRINSAKRYYVRFRLEVMQQGELIFSHDYDARDRE